MLYWRSIIFTIVKSTPPSPAALDVATQIRRQRQALRLTLAEVSQRAGVSIGFLSMLERGRRNPSYDRLQKIWAALGISPAGGDPSRQSRRDIPGPTFVSLLGARLAKGPATLVELARTADTTIHQVGLALADLEEMLRPAGLTVIRDGQQAVLSPRPDLRPAVRVEMPTGTRQNLTEDQYLALAVAAYYGAVTRRQIDELRGMDSHDLLVGLVERGLLSSVMDDHAPGRPRVYRLTTLTLDALGVSSVEELKALLPHNLA